MSCKNIIQMKLRFEKNAVRFRLRRSDLAQLNEHGFVNEAVEFPDSIFTYQLAISDSDRLTAQLIHHSVVVTIPTSIAQNWINSDEVGIYQTIQHGNNKTLDIIIEKDFPCKNIHDEDKNDVFTELTEKKEKGAC